MNLIEKAICFASGAHAGQTDKTGAPLILHPLHMMSLMKNEKARIVAALHDVLEDTAKTAGDLLAEGFPVDVVEAVEALTREKPEGSDAEKDEQYFNYIQNILSNELAAEVKLADLAHNMDISRIAAPSEEDYARLRKYRKARAMLTNGLRQRKIAAETGALDPENSSEYAWEAIVYRHERADYVMYAGVLQLILESASMTYAPLAIVQARAKKLDSFIEKCYRKDCRNKKRDPLTSFTDLCGARIIVHTLQQVYEVSKFIQDNFIIDWDNSVDVSERLKHSEFGYRSIHYIVSLKPGVPQILGVDTNLEFLEGRKAEIQVRTVLQHSWADILHDRIYKSPAEPLQRHMRAAAQIAALTETGDKEYEAFVDDFDNYSLNTTVNMPVKDVERELSILRGMNENEGFLFTKLTNALRMTGFLKIVGRYGEICSVLGGFADTEDLVLDTVVRARLRYEYGYAMCKSAATNKAHNNGLAYIKKAVSDFEYLDDDDSGSWIRYKRLYIEMLLAMGECEKNDGISAEYYEKALGVDASNPYALCNLVQADGSGHAYMPSILKAAIHVADDHLASRVNVPFVYFVLGRLSYAMGREGNGFDYYCRGFSFFANLPEEERGNAWFRDKLELERNYLKNNSRKPALKTLHGVAECLYANIYGGRGSVNKTVFAVPGMYDAAPFADALAAAGLTGKDLDITDEWEAVDALAAELEVSSNDLYMFMGECGQKAETVAKAALAMGIYVICVNPELVEKLSAKATPPRLCGVPNERESLLWVMLTPEKTLDDGFVEEAAQKSHYAYVTSQTKNLWDSAPNMMRWEKLSATFKNANINQVMCSAEIFRQNGFSLVKDTQGAPMGALKYADLTEDEKTALAKSEHGRWVAERVKDGWICGKRDNARKRNENIAAWGDLTDSVKKYDTLAIETLFTSFAEGGYYVLRK